MIKRTTNLIKKFFRNILKSIQLISRIWRNLGVGGKLFHYLVKNMLNNYIFLIISIVILLLFFFNFSSFFLNKEFILYIASFATSFIISLFLFKFKDSETKSFSIRNIIYNIILIVSLMIICIIGIVLFAYFDLLDIIHADGINDINDANGSNSGDKSKEVRYEISGSINKELGDKIMEGVKEIVHTTFEKVIPILGAASAGGAIGAAVVKASAGMSPPHRLGAVAVSAGVGACSTKIGLNIADRLISNSEELFVKTHSVNIDNGKTPSPTIDFFINSPNDITSPLQDLLLNQFNLSILLLILIISFLILIFNLFVFRFNKDYLYSLAERYFSNKVNDLFKKYLNKTSVYNDRFLLTMFIINTIILIYMVLLNLLVSYQLFYNLEDFIEVHNFIQNNKNNILLFIISIKNRDNLYLNRKKKIKKKK